MKKELKNKGILKIAQSGSLVLHKIARRYSSDSSSFTEITARQGLTHISLSLGIINMEERLNTYECIPFLRSVLGIVRLEDLKSVLTTKQFDLVVRKLGERYDLTTTKDSE